MNPNYTWHSGLGDQIQAFLQETRSAGFHYAQEGRLLERLDAYCAAHGFEGISLTRSLVDAFCYGVA